MTGDLLSTKEQTVAKPVRQRDKWRIRWFDENGERQSAVHEDYKVAQKELSRKLVEVDEIRRGLRLAPPAHKTFGALCDYWITNKVPQKRSGGDDESIIRCHLRPVFGELALQRLGVEQVDAFVLSRKHLHPKTVHNILTLVVSMMNVAFELGWIVRVPRIKKPRVRTLDRDFRYLRTSSDIARFLGAARDAGDMVHALYATAVYTGMRAGELAGVRWTDIDFDGRLITVQRSFDGPTKSDRVRYVPVLDALLPILREWRLKNPLAIVFPSSAGTPHAPSARIFQETFQRVLERAGFEKVFRRGKLRSALVFHDLRHTFASAWMLGGGDIFRLQKILGHQSPMMTQRYAHLAPDAYASDYARLGPGPQQQVVLPFDSSKRKAGSNK